MSGETGPRRGRTRSAALHEDVDADLTVDLAQLHAALEPGSAEAQAAAAAAVAAVAARRAAASAALSEPSLSAKTVRVITDLAAAVEVPGSEGGGGGGSGGGSGGGGSLGGGGGGVGNGGGGGGAGSSAASVESEEEAEERAMAELERRRRAAEAERAAATVSSVSMASGTVPPTAAAAAASAPFAAPSVGPSSSAAPATGGASHGVRVRRPADDKDYDVLVKLLLLGDGGVGKTSLMLRFSEDKFSASLLSTAGVDYKTQHLDIDGRKVKLQLWDTAGQARFHTITQSYYKSAHGIVLVYDAADSSEASFHNVRYWMENIQKHANVHAQRVLIGNKCDVKGKKVRQHLPFACASVGMAHMLSQPPFCTLASKTTSSFHRYSPFFAG